MDITEYMVGIKRIALKLSGGNSFLFEDLRSEMYSTLLGMTAGQDAGYYFRAVKNRAIDYLKSRKSDYSSNDNFKAVLGALK